MKKTFRSEIFIYYTIVFALFTVAILTFQYQRERRFKKDQLENNLENITQITWRFIMEKDLMRQNDMKEIDDLVSILPQSNARITVIDRQGVVLYDSFVSDYLEMENHLLRPEIKKAMQKRGEGVAIRTSSTTQQEFYYYARTYPDIVVRAALVYDVEVRDFLKTSRAFIYSIIIMFLAGGILLLLVTLKLSETITKLKNFAVRAGDNKLEDFDVDFPSNELGIISSQIVQLYRKVEKTKDDLANEKGKLFSHLDALEEAIAFFSSKKKQTLANARFVQIVNFLAKKQISSPSKMLSISEFNQLHEFVDMHLKDEAEINSKKLPRLEYTVSKNEKFFKIQVIVFTDKSFEVVITDATRLEKRKLIKQQLTSNIAHELKTPLSSIRGYLETILDNWPVPENKQKYFLEKAFFQSERLTSLINDVSLINNIEDAGELFEMKKIDVKKVLDDIYEYFAGKIEDNKINFSVEVTKGTTIKGSESLLFSIFQNLIENSITYGGKEIAITIKCYHQDEKYYYFSYADTGSGIPEQHLPRIFERFYRVDKGRSRATGGTGLGLAIVKNAVSLHQGNISVKNRTKGGVEFLFSFARK